MQHWPRNPWPRHPPPGLPTLPALPQASQSRPTCFCLMVTRPGLPISSALAITSPSYMYASGLATSTCRGRAHRKQGRRASANIEIDPLLQMLQLRVAGLCRTTSTWKRSGEFTDMMLRGLSGLGGKPAGVSGWRPPGSQAAAARTRWVSLFSLKVFRGSASHHSSFCSSARCRWRRVGWIGGGGQQGGQRHVRACRRAARSAPALRCLGTEPRQAGSRQAGGQAVPVSVSMRAWLMVISGMYCRAARSG